MKLLRVQVPQFRVLKDVDLSFEKDFVPSIFPLGSLNGGGKRTLLQLIFGLLHCSSDPERLPYLQNLLASFKVKNSEEMQTIAKFEILDDDQVFEVEFLSFHKESVKSESFNILLESEINPETKRKQVIKTSGTLDIFTETISSFLKRKNMLYITYFLTRKYGTDLVNYPCALACKINSLNQVINIQTFLKNLSNKIFLIAPSSQVFHFIEKEQTRLLFNKEKAYSQYQISLDEVKTNLPNFFTYDFIAVNQIVKLFENARDKDFQKAVKTGEYGNSYQKLLNDLNLLFSPKKINVTPDLNGVTFKMKIDGEEIELYPEDLSHGELKRISIYAWLKSQNIENSIILMDEIENGFHPDWHYQIISDLEEWSPTNQYILATHSYELCQALTPSHVKELSPKLLK